MKKILYSFLLILLLHTPSYAQSTSEIYFKDFNEFINDKTNDKGDIATDYAVEILKTSPNSLEAIYTVTLMGRIISNKSTFLKYKDLKNKFYSELNNIELNLPEKLILIELIIMGIERSEDYNLCITTLKKIKEDCIDKNYSALATFMLLSDKDEKEVCKEDFIKNFPDHSCIPIIKLITTSNYYGQKDYEKCINESNKLIKEYEKIISPLGWRLVLDYYNLIVFCYISLNDLENATKYYDIIEKEAPNYENLKQLKTILNIKKSK